MITNLLLILIYPILVILKGIYLVLPNFDFLVQLQTPMQDAFAWFYNIAYLLNPIIPYTTLKVVFGTYISYYVLLFSFRGVSWVLRKIPFADLS